MIKFRKSTEHQKQSLPPLTTTRLKSNIFCHTCRTVPRIAISSVDPLKIRLICDVCEDEWVRDFQDLLKESQSQLLNPRFGYCIMHKDRKSKFYCKECKVHYCQKCKEEKQDHETAHKDSIINLANLPSKEGFVKKIKETQNSFEKSNNTLRDICLKRLEEEKERINLIFDWNTYVNSKLIEFVNLLAFNYNASDYHTIDNLINNTEFNLKEIKGNELSNYQIVEEIKTSFILTPYNEVKYPPSKYKATLVKKATFHTKEIRTIVALKDGRIASGSDDETIRIFDINSSSLEDSDITIKENSGVFALTVLTNGNLASYSGTIKIYEINEKAYKLLHETSDYTSFVLKLITLNEKLFASASADKTIKLWQSEPPFNDTKTLTGHRGCVMSIIKLRKKDIIVSASLKATSENGDGTIRFWNAFNEDIDFVCLGTIENVDCCAWNALVEGKENTIFSGSAFRKIFVVDANERKVIKEIKCNANPWCFCEFGSDDFLIGDVQGKLISLDTVEEKEDVPIPITKPFGGSINGITSVDSSTICTCSLDKTIKVWKLEVI